MKRDLTKISLFIVLISLFFSCDAVKLVPEGKYLLTENTILVDSVKTKDAGVYSQLAQKPNSSIPFLGIPFGLHIYNLADPQPDSTYYKWLQTREAAYSFSFRKTSIPNRQQLCGLQ